MKTSILLLSTLKQNFDANCLQILEQRRLEALEIAREKQAFEEVLKVQEKASEKEKLDDLRKQRVCTVWCYNI
jgi:chorismate mutase